MLIKKIEIKNFQLIKQAEIFPDKINIISGINQDDSESSSNGAGKSTLINSILFCLYGEVPGLNLSDLISIGEKETFVTVKIEKGGYVYKIERSIPSNLQIYVDSDSVQRNTLKLKQEYINEVFGSLDYFKKNYLIDKRGINLLDLGIISLRKQLMEFIDTYFSAIRKQLLDKKANRELYNKDKRIYKFYLSDNRLKILNSGLTNLIKEYDKCKQFKDAQQETINVLKVRIGNISSGIDSFKKQFSNNTSKITKQETSIKENNAKIQSAKAQPIENKIDIIDYDILISEKEEEIKIETELLNELKRYKDDINNNNSELSIQINTVKNEIKKIEIDITKIDKEISGLETIKIETKCDKCGSLVSKEHRETYKAEREAIRKELLTKSEELKKELLVINNKTVDLIVEFNKIIADIKESEKIISNISEEIKKLNTAKFNQQRQVESIEKQKLQTTLDIKKYTELIEIYNKDNTMLEQQNKNIIYEIANLTEAEFSLNLNLKIEQDKLIKVEHDYIVYEKSITKTKEYLTKLKEAFKFSEYKYTKKDVELYNTAIKIIDDFAGQYIFTWLNNLEIIINDLLKPVNLKIQFSSDKQFLSIENGEHTLKYDQLSSGQQMFLNIIFKLAILLQNGITEGIIIGDEGLANIDRINLEKILTIFKGLNFQYFLIYHNLGNINDINNILITRHCGVSSIS